MIQAYKIYVLHTCRLYTVDLISVCEINVLYTYITKVFLQIQTLIFKELVNASINWGYCFEYHLTKQKEKEHQELEVDGFFSFFFLFFNKYSGWMVDLKRSSYLNKRFFDK